MHAAILLFYSFATALAQPTESTSTRSDERTLLERADGAEESCAPSGPAFVDVLDTRNVITGCLEECERNPDCAALSLNFDDNVCSLWGSSLNTMNFYVQADSPYLWGDRQCWTLSGPRCDIHRGGFELGSGIPRIDGLVHPWAQKEDTSGASFGTRFDVVKNGEKNAEPFHRTPYGQNFARALVQDFNGAAGISQYFHPDPNISNYKLSYAYNFAWFRQVSGTQKPSKYIINTYACGTVIDTLTIPLSKADNKWKTHTVGIGKLACDAHTKFLMRIQSESVDSTQPGLFTAYFGLDNVMLKQG